MVYTGNPATSNTDAVRLLVYDTSTSTAVNLLTDAEYQWFIDGNSNLYFAGAEAAMSIGISYNDDVLQKKVGDLEWRKGGTPVQQWRALAERLRVQGARKGVPAYAGGISVQDKTANVADADWDRTHTSTGSNPAIWD